MKRFLSIVLSISLLITNLVFMPTIPACAEATSVTLNSIEGETLMVSDVKSFRYSVPTISSETGSVKTKFVKDNTLRQPISNMTDGWDGACIVSSIDGTLTGTVAGKPQESFVLQYLNHDFILGNNTVMFYVELPEYEKAGADWALSISTLYVKQGDDTFYLNRNEAVEYSYISRSMDKWQYSRTTASGDALATLADLPSGFKGYVRIDVSTATFYDSALGAKFDFSKHYRLVSIGYGYNAVGGECGNLLFGGISYFPDVDKCNATIMTARSNYTYQLGGNSDAVLATPYAARYNVTISEANEGEVAAASSAYDASCVGGTGVAIDSTTGEPITTQHYYQKMWPGIIMQPGVDSFMIYVELPTYTADTPALYFSMPGITSSDAYPTFVDGTNSPYQYASVDSDKWETGIIGANGELSELGSGFKGYLKFDLKNFAFYQSISSSGRKAVDFTKPYKVQAVQLRFNHVGGDNGKLVIGSLYSVMCDSDSTKITSVTTADAATAGGTLNIGSVKSMRSTSVAINSDGETYTELTKNASSVQVASDKAESFDGAYVVSSIDGSLTGAVANKANEAFVMQYIDTDLTLGRSSVIFYVEAPDYKKAGAKWGLNISSLAVKQNDTSFNVDLTKRGKYSYLSVTGTEWIEENVRVEDGVNSVLANLPSGFKGYICLDLNNFYYEANGDKGFNPAADFSLSSLGIGYNAVGGECGELLFGGVLYFPSESGILTTDMLFDGRYYKLTKNPAAVVATVGAARYNVSITNTTGGDAASSATYISADCVGRVANGSAVLGSTTDEVVTDLHMYSKNWAGVAMTPGVDTFMTYIEMPTYSETDTALYMSMPSFNQNDGTAYYIASAGGKYSYMSIYDGEWKNASIGTNGELSEIGSGFKGYVKFNLKTFPGYDELRTKLDMTASYNLVNPRFRYKYVGGNNGNLVIGAFYGLVEDSDSTYIAIADKRRVAATRYIGGDLLGDGKINSIDLTIARRTMLGTAKLDGKAIERCDANADGVSLNVQDLVRIKKVSAGAIDATTWKDYTDNSGLTISKWLAGGQIPYYTEGTVTETVSGDGTIVLTAVGTNADTYNAYLKALEFAGFELYTSNVMDSNLFATYINENLTVNVYYIDSNKTVRVVYEPKGELPGLESENVYDKSFEWETLLTSVYLEDEPNPQGQSFIIRLEDGSFIVYDGGMAEGTNLESKKLYDKLMEQTPRGKKPVIAAWLFSHAHADHVGVFNEFSLNYHDKVTIERFFYNFPSEEEMEILQPDVLAPNLTEYGIFKRVMSEYYADIPAIKVHTGNKFYIRNVEVEVLFTYEDFYPTAIDRMNSSSTVFRMHVGGQSILWLGDSTPVSEALMLEQLGSYLKSDVLQLAHHGIDGLLEAYQTYDPTYCLWPAAKLFYKQYINSAPNKWLIRESENVKEVIVSGYGTYSVQLPMDIKGTYASHPYASNYKNPTLIE